MRTGYQEEKKEQYENMMEEIAVHPDFGKRNPVDIGIECGSQEESVLEMIYLLQHIKDKQETNNVPDTVTVLNTDGQSMQKVDKHQENNVDTSYGSGAASVIADFTSAVIESARKTCKTYKTYTMMHKKPN